MGTAATKTTTAHPNSPPCPAVDMIDGKGCSKSHSIDAPFPDAAAVPQRHPQTDEPPRTNQCFHGITRQLVSPQSPSSLPANLSRAAGAGDHPVTCQTLMSNS